MIPTATRRPVPGASNFILEDIRRKIDGRAAGRNFPIGTVLLDTAPATTTTVSARGCSTTSFVDLSPLSAFSAAEVGAGWLWITPGTKEFVINHSASADPRWFRWIVFTPATRA
jgi:hypothetical protein